MITDDNELKELISQSTSNGLSKQLGVMVDSKQYNNVRYFIDDEKENTTDKNVKKNLNMIEDYLIDKIVTFTVNK